MEEENMFDEHINMERTIKSTTDSENVIRELISKGKHSKNIHNSIKSNVEHIKIILNKKEVQESNSPKLLDFQEAIDLGEKFITESSI